jgi:hypothetical protein
LLFVGQRAIQLKKDSSVVLLSAQQTTKMEMTIGNLSAEALSVLNSLSKDVTPVDPTFLYQGRVIDDDPLPAQEIEEIQAQHAQYEQASPCRQLLQHIFLPRTSRPFSLSASTSGLCKNVNLTISP